jgi:NAD(P)-dependent dehydrogenase (short-subunit alcohol dehydrogenase family)
MNTDLTGQNILVTGGSRGIGAAVVRAFAEQGGHVAVNFRADIAASSRLLASLPGSGHVAIQADVSTPDGAELAVRTTIETLGGLDTVVNNAAIRGHHPIAETDFATWTRDWDRLLATNLSGPAHVCFHAAQHMMTHGGGRMVNISSRGAFRGEPDMPAYGASKAGLNAMSQSLAVALAPHGIYVYVVAPGFVQTEGTAERLSGPEGDGIRAQSPLGRVARAEEIAHAVVMLASPGAEFATGTILDMNGASYLRS